MDVGLVERFLTLHSSFWAGGLGEASPAGNPSQTRCGGMAQRGDCTTTRVPRGQRRRVRNSHPGSWLSSPSDPPTSPQNPKEGCVSFWCQKLPRRRVVPFPTGRLIWKVTGFGAPPLPWCQAQSGWTCLWRRCDLAGFGTRGSHNPPPTTPATSGSLCKGGLGTHPPAPGSAWAPCLPCPRAESSQSWGGGRAGGPAKGCPPPRGRGGKGGADPGSLCKAAPLSHPGWGRSPRQLRPASHSPAWQAKRGGGV